MKQTAGALLAAGPSLTQLAASKPAGPIWDLHCHFGGFEGRTREEKGAAMLRFADRLGIERLCTFMGNPPINNPSPEQLRDQNGQVLQVISRWPDRLFGFVYLNPIRDGAMVGVKLWMACRANTPALDPVVARAAELRARIFQHTWLKTGGNLPGESTPMELAELALRHPSIPMICGDTGRKLGDRDPRHTEGKERVLGSGRARSHGRLSRDGPARTRIGARDFGQRRWRRAQFRFSTV